MQKFGKSQPVKRVEDVRFLTGAGRYVDDIAPEGALHGFFLRSPRGACRRSPRSTSRRPARRPACMRC